MSKWKMYLSICRKQLETRDLGLEEKPGFSLRRKRNFCFTSRLSISILPKTKPKENVTIDARESQVVTSIDAHLHQI